jgi:hypothetical protein
MSSTTVAPAGAAKSTGSPKQDQSGIERRRRHRAKITAQVHVRAANFPDGFEEVCASVDVSRDGLLFLAICMAKPFQPERLLHVVRLVAPPPTVRSFYGARTANTRNL